MSAYRILFAPRAGKDLRGIYEYVAQTSPSSAPTVVERILDASETLVEFPHRTIVETKIPQSKFPIRSLPVRPFVIYFRVLEDDKVVRIVHIRHGARRRPLRFD
jgi:plasmid stabilization system protein ParE